MATQNSTLANYSLCHLLGINVDEIALQIVIKDQTIRKTQRQNQNKENVIPDKLERIA